MSNKSLPELDILYEDSDIAAVNKPSGLMVHPDGRSDGPFLTDWILKKFPDTATVGEPAHAHDGTKIERPGIVHRLDRETSGVLLVAKTAAGHACLKQQFKDRTIKKKYVAFVWGDLEEEFGTIDRPIGRSSGDFRKWSAQRGARGEVRDAETYWTKLGYAALGEAKDQQSFTLMEAEPKTGRTHQIRVHFAAIQHPVVGDSLYAPSRPKALDFERTALHARSIEFDNVAGKRIRVEAPLPEDFVRACQVTGIKVK
jgi:23S rRNA pseudouridine1911/1915/1917 synthase